MAGPGSLAGPGPGFDYDPGYVPPGYEVPPVIWVKVPIMRERRGCDCEEVIEEETIVASPTRRARRVIHRRAAPGKDLPLGK